jgi:hypothetical protein
MHCLCVDRRNKGICQKNIFKKLKSHFFAIAAYIIWYGTWTASAKNIVQQFVANVGNTGWWAINQGYGVGRLVTIL